MNNLTSDLEKCLKQHVINIVYEDRNKTPSTQNYKDAMLEVEEFLNNNVAVENVVNSVRIFFDLR